MFELTQRKADIFRSWINPFLSLMFVGSFALGAFLIVYDTAFGNNPVAEAFVAVMEREQMLANQ